MDVRTGTKWEGKRSKVTSTNKSKELVGMHDLSCPAKMEHINEETSKH